jgi:POT family proton-dependent oligopeptide transporter
MSTTGKQPAALYLIAAAGAGERFAYYGMRAILMLYMIAGLTGQLVGMNFSQETAGIVYGVFNALCYGLPFFGGILADRVIGNRKSVSIGGVFIILGLIVLSLDNQMVPFVGGLTLIAIGNGFFKPTVVSMIGALYEQGDPRRDGAFTLYYQLFNVGAFIAPLLCGYVAVTYGYLAGFMVASVAVFFSMLIYWVFAPRYLKEIGKLKKKEHSAAHSKSEAVALTKEERDRISVIFVLLFFVTFFWTGFEQAGSSMTVFTEQNIDKSVGSWSVPTAWFQGINPFFVFILGFVISAIWLRLHRIGKNPSIPVKMGLGMMFLGLGFVIMLGAVNEFNTTGAKAGMMWIVAAYFLQTIGELMLSPIGLSMITKLAPERMVSMFMGLWFLPTFLAHLMGGFIAGYSKSWGYGFTFGGIAIFVVVLGGVVIMLRKRLVLLMHGRG